jgi:Zn-dependent peptidase ImmA (M78 family)
LRIVDPSEIEYEAIVEKLGNGFRISLANDRAGVRQNFSIAHEVAHLFLHMGYIVSPDKWNAITRYEDSVRARHGYTEEEHEANQFAAAFLMPEDEFVKVASSAFGGEHYDLRIVAEHFGVSERAVKTRGQWLGLFSWD